jgi:trehalose synthase
MSLVHEVPIRPKAVEFFASILEQKSLNQIRDLAQGLQEKLNGRVIWNINSTAAGGGVAEMLHTLLAYARGIGVDTRWLVIGGNADFFRITKRIHNALHGEAGDGSPLDAGAASSYQRITDENARELASIIGPEDVVILHDPQTAGLIPHLVRRGNSVVWRCHIGIDMPSPESEAAWSFLESWLTRAQAFVFSRFTYLPGLLYHGRCLVSPPLIDPFSPKNHDMDDEAARSILAHIGIVSGEATEGRRALTLPDGSRVTVERTARVLREGPPPPWETPLVVQVSRWDSLKDPVGVLQGFVRCADGNGSRQAHLVLAGPSVDGVTDDPEGGQVFEQVVAAWRSLPEERRRRVALATLPMDDLEENAVMVNALQRHAAVVVQKSLREGFGLTVTEAMWKARPVIASAVGGIQDQIEHGVSGLLLRNPTDLDAFAGALNQVLASPGWGDRLGSNARQRVGQNYLGPWILAHFDDLVERLDLDRRTAAA